MSLDVIAYLAGKGYRGRPASGGREITYACFFDCAEPADSKKKKLYVNVEEGVYSCKVCGTAGGPYSLQRHFGDDPRAGTSDDAFTRRRILDWAMQIGAEMLSNRDDVLLYLMNERGLSPETILERQLGFVGAGWSLTGSLPADFTRDQLAQTGLVWKDGPRAGRDYFHNHVLIPITARGHVIQIRGRVWGEVKGGKYLSGPGEPVRAYNIDSLEGAEEAVLTEGEFDAMRLHEALRSSNEQRARRIAVVGLPGTSAFPDELDDYLSEVKRIYIGFDSDEPGKLAAEKLREKYGARARVLTLPNQDGRKADWTEYLLPVQDRRGFAIEHPYAGHDASDVLRLMSQAAGKRIHSVAESGAAFRTYRAENAGLQTGWSQLDSVIHPGLLPGQVAFILAKTGAGKGHIGHQEIPTPSGYRKWKDLRVGDQIFGSDGTPTTVTGVYDRGLLPTYRVQFSDGTNLQVDGDHLWAVNERRGHRREWHGSLMSTQELLEAGLRKGVEYRWTIPMAGAAQYPEADLPVEPYTLGALLANGYLAASTAALTTPDYGVVERIRCHYTVGEHKATGCPRFAVHGVIGILRELGLCQLSPDKYIPEIYLTASIDQRVALLQGLMDGDGSNRTRHARRSVLYFTSSRRLADGVCELVASLGGTAKQWWTQRGDARPEGKVSIVLPDGISAFSTTRKDERPQMKYNGGPRRAIVAIEPAGDELIRCISVAAPDQLYLVGRDYIVTHNTLILCNLAYQMRKQRILFISLEMTREEVYHRLARIYWHYHPTATTDELEYALANVWICDENRLGERDLMALVNEYAMETGHNPDVVFVDYLGYYARGAKGSSPYEKTTNAAMQLKADAKSGRLVIISPAQVNRLAKNGKTIELDDARDSGAIEETGDYVLAAYRPDAALTEGIVNVVPTWKLMLSVLKSRHGGVGRTITLQMDALTLAIAEEGTRAAKIAEEHNMLGRRGKSWEDLRAEQTRPRQLSMPAGAS